MKNMRRCICTLITLLLIFNVLSVVPIKVQASSAIEVSHDASSSQTITYSIDSGTTTYYWGTNSNYKNNPATNPSSNTTLVKKIVSSEGSYYMTTYREVWGSNGFLAGTVTSEYDMVRFYKISLDANGGTVGLSFVLASDYAGGKTDLPIPQRTGYEFKGWATSKSATSGVTSVCPSSNTTYYAIWSYIDNTAPEIYLKSIKGLNTDEVTFSFTASDNVGVDGYYWGTSSDYQNNAYKTLKTNSFVEYVYSGGTYYCFAKDKSGNISNAVSQTINQANFDPNGGSISRSVVLFTDESTFSYPTPARDGYTFEYWQETSDNQEIDFNNIDNNGYNIYNYKAIWKKNTTNSNIRESSVAKVSQKISAKPYKKSYGNKPFNIKAKTSGNGKLSYKSSNKKVATVSSKGKAIIKGCGKTTITIKASSTAKYTYATKKITITVKPGKLKVTGYSKGSSITFKQQPNADGYIAKTKRVGSNYKKIFSASKNKKSISVKGLPKGKYKIKLSAWKKISSKKVYGKETNVIIVIG